MDCCADPKFELAEELGHAESVDWDLGRCTACGAHLLRQWSEYRPNSVFYDKLTGAEANAFAQSRDRARVLLLKKWYNDH